MTFNRDAFNEILKGVSKTLQFAVAEHLGREPISGQVVHYWCEQCGHRGVAAHIVPKQDRDDAFDGARPTT